MTYMIFIPVPRPDEVREFLNISIAAYIGWLVRSMLALS